MKSSILILGAALLVSALAAHSEMTGDRVDRPCFSVNVQNEAANSSTVKQSCDRNYSRTVQAGGVNIARTKQMGEVNNSKTRQFWYDRMEYLDRIRGE